MLNRPQRRIKLQQIVAMAVATTLCLHLTIGDPQRFRIVPAKSLRINVLSPWISGLLVGSHRGIISHRGGAGELTGICLQSAEAKYIHWIAFYVVRVVLIMLYFRSLKA